MSIEKTIPGKISSYDLYNVGSKEDLEKVASDLIKLPEGFTYDPDCIYLLIRIVSSGAHYGPNNNGDYFPEEELINSYETFNQAHTFKNHENKDVEGAIGEIISVQWNPVMKTTEVLKSIDTKAAPAIARGYLKGYMTDVSMGCRVPFTVCSICGNKASKPKEFCDHVKKHKLEYLDNGERVFEYNFSPKFHDSSVVIVGAERSAKAMLVLDEKDFSDDSQFVKTASADNKVFHFQSLSDYENEKIASFKQKKGHPIFQTPDMVKVASGNNSILQKLAALEKMVSGKIIGVVSEPDNLDKSALVIRMIKLIGDGRLGSEDVEKVVELIKEISKNSGLPTEVVFGNFVTLSKMMSVELLPTELHEIAKALSVGDHQFYRSSDGDVEMSQILGLLNKEKALDKIPLLNHPTKIVRLYKKMPIIQGKVNLHSLSDLITEINAEPIVDEVIPNSATNQFISLLNSLSGYRGANEDNLMSRIYSHMHSGNLVNKPIRQAYTDAVMLSSPRKIGDFMGHISYHSANQDLPERAFEKVAKIIFDVGKNNSHSKVARLYNNEQMEKRASLSLQSLKNEDALMVVKIASEHEVGNYNLFSGEMLDKYALDNNFTNEETGAIKATAILKIAGEEELASRVQNAYKINDYIAGHFTKYACNVADEEMDKIAKSFEEALVYNNFENSELTKVASHLDTHLCDNIFLRVIANLT